MRVLLVAVATLAIVGGCRGGRAAVTAAEFGADWPFPGIEGGEIECKWPELIILLRSGDQVIALNHVARHSQRTKSGEWIDGLELARSGSGADETYWRAYRRVVRMGLDLCEDAAS